MQIQRDKFFAITATLAGFWPNAACVIEAGGGTASGGSKTTTGSTSTATSGTTETGGETGTGAPTTGAPTTGTPTSEGTITGADEDRCTVHDTPGCADDAVATRTRSAAGPGAAPGT